jgi:hypothetical protein
MIWQVEFHPTFLDEFQGLSEEVQDNILAKSLILERFGPQLGRPHADSLEGSKHANMKELRLDADGGIWRIAFAFDPERKAILLVAGDKAGKDQKRFYKKLIKIADERFDQHLNELQKHKKK